MFDLMESYNNNGNRSVSQVSNLVIGFQNRLDHGTINNPKLGNLVLSTEGIRTEAEKGMIANAFNEIKVCTNSLASELGISGSLTVAQENAAAAAGILASNYKKFIGSKFRSFSPNADNARVIDVYGIEDAVSERSFGIEAYDESENKNATIYSIVYNMQSSRQDEFGETFFPTITISPDLVGFDIAVELMTVFDGIEHKISGDIEDFKRKNIIRAVADPTILKKDQTKAVPVFRPQSASHFVDSTVIPPSNINLDGVEFQTSPLKFGVKNNLLALSMHDQLLAGGVMDHTDSLDPYVTLSFIYIKIGNDILKFNTSNLPLSNFVRSIQNDYRAQVLNFSTNSLLVNDATKQYDGSAFTEPALQAIVSNQYIVRLSSTINGNVNIETGENSVFGNGVEVYTIMDTSGNLISTTTGIGQTIANAFASAEFLGYDITAYRTNMNRRQRGQLINTRQFSYRYSVPLRSPIAAMHPINADAQVDASDVQALVTTTRIRVSNEAVTSLLNTSVILSEYVDSRDSTSEGPDVLGVGRFYVRPTYYEETIDMATAIDSIKSHERAMDMQAVLVNKLRDYAFRMYRDSEYKAAADALAGGIAPMPTVIIGTDPVLARYLNVTGDLRTLGGEFDVRIVSTLDRRMASRIIATFGIMDANRNSVINPLNFGNMFWAPELVLTANISRGGQISRETVVQPRYLFVAHLPVMTVLTVENVPDVLNKVTINFHSL